MGFDNKVQEVDMFQRYLSRHPNLGTFDIKWFVEQDNGFVDAAF